MSQTAGPSDSTGDGTINTTDSSRSFPMSTSLGSQMQLLVLMLAPGSANAPYFVGPRARTFLETLHHLCDNTRLSNNKSVNQIYWFSSTQDVAKSKFLELYSSLDQEPTVTLNDLQKFCTRQSKKAPFMDRFKVDHYHQTFLCYSGPLLKKKTITKAESYYYFILGLPTELKKWLETQMPQEKKNKEDTLTISKTLAYLYIRFDTSNIFYNTWKDNSTSKPNQIHFDKEGEQKAQDSTHIPPLGTSDRNQGSTGIPSNSVDDLIKQMKALKLNQVQVLSLLSGTSKNMNIANPPFSSFSSDLPKHCFMCSIQEPHLEHQLHISHCLETKKLVVEGHLKWDEALRRYILVNGRDLP
ncbi:hypothetical protein L218DRAFT_1003652 [Marasmius fiardii PR-910]|nr:hypothetical protein L218DRAFT_1003652 [Marasmius fiardii PR-910]